MKKLTKLAAAALTGVALLIGTTVNAQTTPTTPSKLRFGIGLEAGAPTGNMHNYSNVEIGGTARLQYNTSDHFALMLTSGYYNFFGKDYSATVGGVTTTVKGSSAGMIPVKAGFKAFFADQFYFSAEAGAGFETTGINKNTKLILSPGLGWANQKWDVGVRYEDFSGQSNSYGIVGLRLAYGFEL
jgi:hypothetical protein